MNFVSLAKIGLTEYVGTMSDFQRAMIGAFDMLFFIVQCLIFIAVGFLFAIAWVLPVLFYEFILIKLGKRLFNFFFGHLL
jgi:hypothetical protein